MNRLGIVAAAVLIAAAGASAGAQETSNQSTEQDQAVQQNQSAEQDQSAQQEKKICRSEKMTGSLTRVRRTCLTKAQWDELAEATRRSVDDVITDANQAQAALPPNAVGPGT